MKHAGRVCMRHAVGDKLVYMHEALALRLKLQKAAYCEAAEKWDSDSDSDKSEDEGRGPQDVSLVRAHAR